MNKYYSGVGVSPSSLVVLYRTEKVVLVLDNKFVHRQEAGSLWTVSVALTTLRKSTYTAGCDNPSQLWPTQTSRPITRAAPPTQAFLGGPAVFFLFLFFPLFYHA